MVCSLLAVVVDCRDSRAQARWWADVLGHAVSERNAAEYKVSHPTGGGTPMYFMNVPEPKAGKNRLHVDISVDGPLPEAVDSLIASGAKLIELRQDPDALANPDTWAVMADPEGNEFCVLAADTVTGMT